MHAEPADRYEPAPGLWVVTSYFNANGYRTRRANYERFAEPIRRSGLGFLTVECAFPGAPFALEPGPDVLRVAGRDVMWQKERLLNLAIAALPAGCAKVVWLVTYGTMVAVTKVTFTLDEATVDQLRRTAARVKKSQSQVVREAIRDYAARANELTEDERQRLLETFDELVPKIPARPLAAVEAELRELRASRRRWDRRPAPR